MSSITELRKQKREWLKKTVNSTYLKRHFKWTDEEISQIKSEVNYGEERYNIDEVKKYIDAKLNKQSAIAISGNAMTKTCKKCEKNVNKDFFSSPKAEICMKCEKKIERKNDRKLDKISSSRIKWALNDEQLPLI